MSSKLARIISRTSWTRLESKRSAHAPKSRKKSRLLLEALEHRVVPAAPLVSYVLSGTAGTEIAGTVYEDLDQNGIRSGGENGISGWTVYLDLDNSGTLNHDAAGDLEPSALTNQDGDFTINHLVPGTYRVAQVIQDGWAPTSPASQDVTVTAGKTTLADFFNFSGGAIVGTVWNDLDQDGSRATDPATGAFTEPGLAGWSVFLDLDNNQALDADEPTTLTDAEGRYKFVNLPPSDYEVFEILPDTWDVSPGFDSKQTAGVVARGEFVVDFANFSLSAGSLKGTIWNDLNANGIRESDPATGAFTEPGLAGWTVYLDTNNNRMPEPGELTTTTDANGDYSFISLPEGDYEVTEVLPDGWYTSPAHDFHQTVTVFAGEETTAEDFANFTFLNGSIRGTVWNDLNRNGLRDMTLGGTFTDPGLAGWTIFLDRNRNGVADPDDPSALSDANGVYVFADLQVGDYEVREVLPSGWEPSAGFGDSHGVTVYSGAESIAPDFANFNVTTAVAGSVSGTVWNDLTGNGVRDVDPTSGGFTDPGLGGWTIFVDVNSNGILDTAEPSITSAADGSYTISGVMPGSVRIVEVMKPGWRSTAPLSGIRTLALKNAENASGLDFGNEALKNSTIRGTVFADTSKDSVRDPGEPGLGGITVYLDLNNSGTLDSGEPQTVTSADQFFTPAINEAGSYSFTHLAAGTHTVRVILPDVLSATPAEQLGHTVTMVGAEDHSGVDFAARYRDNEIHGVKFDDRDGDHVHDADELGVGGVTIFIDIDRDNVMDESEPRSVTLADGSYTFTGLTPGAYVVREVLEPGHESTYPTTTGGILWPDGVSNPAVGNVSPGSITVALASGASHRETVSITLPNTGALTDLVDVFLLFDDTGSFVNNSPIVRGAFPTIISQLQASLPGIDLGFGVGRFEEYANFAWEYASGRPFVLNQPIVAASTPGYLTAIQAALNRTTPGYGGDLPETDIEALYQLVTGLGFDGNNNGSVLDSGVAGLVSTQLNPGTSGDVPSFASFVADASGSVLPAAGTVGGGGFRAGALPIILLATDTGFAYQPKGETTIAGVGGLTLPISALTQTSRPTTPFNYGADLQETITALNSLGALVIGLGTNADSSVDPRQGLEAISQLTGAVNRSTTTIANGTTNAIAPGDPLYFQIASGFATSVANGVVSAIQNAVTTVAMDITVQASDPRVKIINYTGVHTAIGSGQTATFDVEFTGDGVPHRFDLQFVRAGTNVVLGSIPVVIGTPIPGDGYEFEDLSEGEICTSADFGSHAVTASTYAPTITVSGGTFTFDGTAHFATATATGIDSTPVAGTFTFTYSGSTSAPMAAGTYAVQAIFTSSDPNYSNASGTAMLTIDAATPTVTVTGGTFTFDSLAHTGSASASGIDGAPVAGMFTFAFNGSTSQPTAAGTYDVLATFTSSDPNYANATGMATLTIVAATPTVAVTGGNFPFDGLTHTATATAMGVDGAPVAGVFTFNFNGLSIAPSAAGTYDVTAMFVSSDLNYANGSGTAQLTIAAATPTISITGGPFVYDGTTHAVIARALGIDGAVVAGTFAITYNGSTTLPTNSGLYEVIAAFTSGDANYADDSAKASVAIDRATPVFSNLSAPTIDAGTATATISGHLEAPVAIFPTGEQVSVTLDGVTRMAVVDGGGNFSVDFATDGLSANNYAISFSYAGTGVNFIAAEASSTLTVNATVLPIDAAGLSVATIAGAPFTLPVATITHALGDSSSYTATIAWGDGRMSVGVISGTGATLTVTGSHTYADPGTSTIRVTIQDTRGLSLSATTISSATVTSLDLPAFKTKEAKFWQTTSGQKLLLSFNGGVIHTELADWLSTNFPGLYGANAGVFNLAGKSNTYVAAFFKNLWRTVGDGAATQVLTTALNVYATTSALGGAQGALYGFKVSATGLGARIFDVGSAGAAVGVANKTKLNVFEMLAGVDQQAKNGILYAGNLKLQSMAKSLFNKLNTI